MSPRTIRRVARCVTLAAAYISMAGFLFFGWSFVVLEVAASLTCAAFWRPEPGSDR